MPRLGLAYRGEKRVEVGSKCRAGKHGKCTVQECECDCHTREFSTWDQADAHRTTTRRPLRYEAGKFLVVLALATLASGCAAMRDYAEDCRPETDAAGRIVCQPRVRVVK